VPDQKENCRVIQQPEETLDSASWQRLVGNPTVDKTRGEKVLGAPSFKNSAKRAS
jgi:hypothetical protein